MVNSMTVGQQVLKPKGELRETATAQLTLIPFADNKPVLAMHF